MEDCGLGLDSIGGPVAVQEDVTTQPCPVFDTKNEGHQVINRLGCTAINAQIDNG